MSPLLLRAFALVVCPYFSTVALAQCELETQELTPFDGEPGDTFGYRVERDGNVAVVAAPYDMDLGVQAGSAYVYEREGPGSDWVLAKKLLASDGAAEDFFSYSVGVAGTTVAIGALHHSHPVEDGGAVYVFERDAGGPGNWGEVAHFTPEGTSAGAFFGYALAMRGDLLLVGAPYQGQSVPGFAYLYRRDASSATGWTLADAFTSGDPATAFEYGHDVALHDGVMAVSGTRTPMFPYAPTYVAHVREQDVDGNWAEVARIETPNSGMVWDFFAHELSLDADRLAVVAPGEYDGNLGTVGALYLYERDGYGHWERAERIPPPVPSFTAEEADVRGDWLVAGLPSNNSVLVFHRNAGGPDAWGEVTSLSGDEPGSDFGVDLVLQGHELLVGNSYLFENDEAGEVYAFDLARLALASWRSDGGGVNPDVLTTATRPVLGTELELDVALSATGHSLALLAIFSDSIEHALPSGAVLLGAHRLGAAQVGDPSHFAIAIPADATLCGLSVVAQAGLFGSGLPLALSNAQDLVLGAE